MWIDKHDGTSRYVHVEDLKSPEYSGGRFLFCEISYGYNMYELVSIRGLN